MKADSIPFNEDYFRRQGRGSSYTEEYWTGSRRIYQWFRARLQIVESYIQVSTTVLDLGCGLGHSSHVLKSINRNINVLAIDISEVAINRANELYGHDPNIMFVVADATKLPLRSNSIDLVVSFETYEHLENPIEMLKEIHRVLKCDGVVLISTPNARSLSAIVKGDRWVELSDETHVSLTTPEQLKVNLRRLGFEVLKCFTHGFPILNAFERLLKRLIKSPLGLGSEILVIAKKKCY